MVLTHNKLGQNFMKGILKAVLYDDYLRTLDLRKNKLSSAIFEDASLDVIKNLSQNESLTNIDFRGNEGLSKDVKYKLSLIMIRNLDKYRE